jgi:hypothetical protein
MRNAGWFLGLSLLLLPASFGGAKGKTAGASKTKHRMKHAAKHSGNSKMASHKPQGMHAAAPKTTPPASSTAAKKAPKPPEECCTDSGH